MKNLKNLMPVRKINFLIIIDLALIAAALCLINFTDLDVKIQNYFFNFETKSWLIDKDEPIKKFIFYKFPKILLGVAIVFLLVGTVIGFRWTPQQVRGDKVGVRGDKVGVRGDKDEDLSLTCHLALPPCHPALVAGSIHKHRHKFFMIFLGLVLIPAIAGNIKKFTNVYCPSHLEIYGETKPYVKIFDHYPENFYQEKKAKCFPGGHAVTGFALFILFFALQKKSHKFLGLFAGFFFGWLFGIYQMMKGAHFFGDTLVSMLVCFLIAAVITKIYSRCHASTGSA
jgi:membrane-associated PAP2 superfamily phosphatase